VAAPRFGPRHLIWLAALAAIAVAAVLPVTLISGSNDSSLDKAAPATQTLNRADGTRYDGGPEEGSRGVRSALPPSSADAPNRSDGLRYDGGPEEGTRGVGLGGALGARYDGGPEEGTAAPTQRSARATFHPNSITRPPGVRYDGGPEEGTRDIVPAQPPSTRYDGGPEEGSRGTSH
jgi:hypothetical protein